MSQALEQVSLEERMLARRYVILAIGGWDDACLFGGSVFENMVNRAAMYIWGDKWEEELNKLGASE